MIQIRPVSDLRNKFPDIERLGSRYSLQKTDMALWWSSAWTCIPGLQMAWRRHWTRQTGRPEEDCQQKLTDARRMSRGRWFLPA